MAYFGGIFFANMGGGGWSKLSSELPFEANPQNRWRLATFLRPVSKKPCDFCSGMVVSPLAAAVGHCDSAMRFFHAAKVWIFICSWHFPFPMELQSFPQLVPLSVYHCTLKHRPIFSYSCSLPHPRLIPLFTG